MLLNYVHHQNVNGQQDTLDKIRSFAVTEGWTQEAWTTGYRWGDDGGYGFNQADPDGAYLELSSTGYGTQSLIVRLETYLSYGDESTPVVGINMVDTAGHSAIQTLPWCQDRLTYGYDDYTSRMGTMNIGTAQYDDLWIYGDDKWIGATLCMDGIYCQHLHFGSFIMYEDNPSQGQVRGMTIHNASGDYEWQNYLTNGVGLAYSTHGGYDYISTGKTYPTLDFYWDNRSSKSSVIAEAGVWFVVGNVFPWDSNGDAPTYLASASHYQDPFLNIGTCLKANNFSGKRLLLRQNYWIQRQSDSLWVPVCKTPIYFLNFSGLTIGETLSYGTEDFLVFPFGPYQSPFGMAVQIA